MTMRQNYKFVIGMAIVLLLFVGVMFHAKQQSEVGSAGSMGSTSPATQDAAKEKRAAPQNANRPAVGANSTQTNAMPDMRAELYSLSSDLSAGSNLALVV
jgi:hypothetical protein